MRVLLILHSDKNPGAGIVVSVEPKLLWEKVLNLLEGNKGKEAFDLLKKKAIPVEYIEPGQKLEEQLVTLVEDDL